MKLSKSNLFVAIWIVHLFVYYTTYSIILRIIKNDFNEFYFVFIGFVGSFIGIFERIPFFPIIPLAIMGILVKKSVKLKWFFAYSLSVFFTYIINYCWLFFNRKNDMTIDYPNSTDLIYFILPSLIVSILCNWLIFRKKYKKLGV